MPKTPYTRDGATVSIADGGTGAEDAATARSNLGAGDLTTLAHASVDHALIPGAGPTVDIVGTKSGDGISTSGTATIVIPAGWLDTDFQVLEVTFWPGPPVSAFSFNGSNVNFPPSGEAVVPADQLIRIRLMRTGPTTCDWFLDRANNPNTPVKAVGSALTWANAITISLDWNTSGTAGSFILYAKRLK